MALEKAGFTIKNVIIWDKIIHGLNYQNYAHTYEMIIFGVKGNFFPQNKGKYFRDIWHIQRDISQENKEEYHETIKKIDIVRLPILHGSNIGEIVLDCFLGSGTTAVACKQLGRKYIGIEINSEYIEMAKKKLQQEILFK